MPSEEERYSENKRAPSNKRKSQMVLKILAGQTSVEKVSSGFKVSVDEVTCWMEIASEAVDNALRARPLNPERLAEAKIADLKSKIDELMKENNALKKLQSLHTSSGSM